MKCIFISHRIIFNSLLYYVLEGIGLQLPPAQMSSNPIRFNCKTILSCCNAWCLSRFMRQPAANIPPYQRFLCSLDREAAQESTVTFSTSLTHLVRKLHTLTGFGLQVSTSASVKNFHFSCFSILLHLCFDQKGQPNNFWVIIIIGGVTRK